MSDDIATEAVVEYDQLDPADGRAALAQAWLQAYGEPIGAAQLEHYGVRLAAGQASRLALVLELVDGARQAGRQITLRFSQPMQSYLPGLAAGASSGEGMVAAAAMRVVDLSEMDGLAPEEFVRACYIQILGKPADPEGLAHFLHRMATGSARLSVPSDLARAARLEGESVIFQLQPQALGRFGQGPAPSLAALLSGSDQACIEALYQAVLGKAADEGGLAHYQWQLTSGRSRLSLFTELRRVAAQEGRQVIVDFDLDEAALQQLVGLAPQPQDTSPQPKVT